VSFRPSGSRLSIKEKGVVGVVRYIGMDVHREFAQVAVVEDGLVRDEGRIAVTPEALREWAAELRVDIRWRWRPPVTVMRSRTC
jgi:hypothetical protein